MAAGAFVVLITFFIILIDFYIGLNYKLIKNAVTKIGKIS
jgi:hypothetical protein